MNQPDGTTPKEISDRCDANEPDDPVAVLAESFLERLRRGERPALTEYCERHPEWADRIRELFPAVALLEQLAPQSGEEFDRSHPPAGTINRPLFEQVGDYLLIREIGRGGMGVVYEAEQRSLGRHVAIKLLPAHGAKDAQVLERFRREARAAARLHHTNIVPVFEVGQFHDVYFYAMQYIQGQGLDEVLIELRRVREHATGLVPLAPALLRHGASAGDRRAESNAEAREPLGQAGWRDEPAPFADMAEGRSSAASRSVAATATSLLSGSTEPHGLSNESESNPQHYFVSVARIGVQVADALAYAHERGVIHRDIKPSNLLMDAAGTVWVTDFGLAKTEEEALTRTGDIVGTLRYMAPERFRGDGDPRSDVYGLGITLYELLTLQSAFQSPDRLRLIEQVTHDEPIRPRRLAPHIPRDLETIVLKAITKSPSDRYSSAMELGSDLRRFLEDKPIQARQAGWAEQGWRWCRRNPRVALLIGSVATLLIVIAVGSMLAARSLKYERDAARKAEKLARTAGEQAAQSDKERRQELFRAYLAEIRAAHASPQQGHRLRGLQTVKSILSALSFQELTPPQQTELRDETIACLTHPDLREVARYSVSQNIGHPVDLDPTFQFLAVPIGDHDTLIRSLAGESPDVRLSHGTLGATINSERWFSPNGRWLAELLDFVSGNPRRIRVWEWPAQRLVLDLDGPSGFFAPRFHPDGQRCLIVTTDAKVQVYDLLNGQLERESPAHFRGRFLSLRPDLRDLVLLRHEMPPEIADWASWQIKATLSEAGVVHSLAWNPVTMSLYLGARDGRVFQWDDTESRARPLPHHHFSPILNLTVSPSGRYLAASHSDRSLRLRALDGNREMVVASGECLRFSPDEQRIAVKSDSDLIIYELIDSSAFTTIMQAARAADFSPDGRWLAISGVHGVQLYSTNPPTLKSDLGLDECGPVAWHPHGRELITFGQFSHAMRWPLKSESDAAGLEIGPAQRVVVKSLLTHFGINDNIPQHSGRHSAWSADGKLLVYAENRKSHVCTVAESGTPQDLGDLVDAGQVAVTHDGRWIACATATGRRSVVWRASDRQPVLDLPQFGFVSFSPDGEWFVTTSRSHMRWYRVATWQLEREWPMDVVNGSRCGPVAFQPQGRLLAAVVSRNCVRLFDAPTGDVVANLTYEKQSDFSWLSFSPDGARLAVTRPDLDVSLWDLHSLNRELIQAGLAIRGLPETSVSITNRDVRSLNRGQQLLAPDGWWSSFHTLARFEALHSNWPDAIDDLDKALHVAPMSNHKLRADLLTLRGQYQAKNNRPNAALADWQLAQQLNSDHLTSRHELVRLLLHGPPDLRNAEHAAQHLKNLVSRTDGRLEDQLDLALALLRLGRDRAALEQLERIAPPDLEERPAQWLRYRYLFAETLAKLGRTAEAATHFTEAETQWGQRRDSLTADEQRTISEQRQLAKQRIAPD